jgi:AbrB family looped-hinge helix DNA binding protein
MRLRLGNANAKISGMSITITLGKAGRLVVPKPIREALGLREGSRLRLETSAGKFEAIPQADDLQIQIRDGFPVIRGGRPRKKGDIVKAIKAGREECTERIISHRKRK